MIAMHFEALYYKDKLLILNPAGDVGIVTLWSLPKTVAARLSAWQQEWIESLPTSLTARLAVVGSLYGNGLPHLLRNLLWNPQIRHLLVLGENLSGSKEELLSFFAQGLEETEYLGVAAHRIRGTRRILDNTVVPEMFENRLNIVALGKLSDPETRLGVHQFLTNLPPQDLTLLPRQNLPIPTQVIQRYPSEPRNHAILRDSPLEAWEELIFRLFRFGYRIQLQKGIRYELQNVKVVVRSPAEVPDEQLAAYGFSLEKFRHYREQILNPINSRGTSYSYGNRLRGYYPYEGGVMDTLAWAVQRLQEDPESRHAYISLWDTARDLPAGTGCPCFVLVFFRKFENLLTMTATFRTHNGFDAWLENFHGLMGIQAYVASRVALEPGPITVISHSISLDENSLDRARAVAMAKKSDQPIDPLTGKPGLRHDANGYFTITHDPESDEIVVHHLFQGQLLWAYRGRTAESLEHQLARDHAVSEISHALYVGREIARLEARIKSSRQKSSSCQD